MGDVIGELMGEVIGEERGEAAARAEESAGDCIIKGFILGGMELKVSIAGSWCVGVR